MRFWLFEARQREWASSLDRTSLVCGVMSASANGRMVKFHDCNALKPLTRFTSWEKTPQRGERGALRRKPVAALAVGGELAALGLLEAGVLPLRGDLPQDGAVQRGVRRL